MMENNITESRIKEIINETVKQCLLESKFYDTYLRVKDYHNRCQRPLGFELRKNGKWVYGDIEYNKHLNTLSCLGVSIKVDLTQSFGENMEDLFEELFKNGYDTDF